MIVETLPPVGLTDEHVQELVDWADELAQAEPDPAGSNS